MQSIDYARLQTYVEEMIYKWQEAKVRPSGSNPDTAVNRLIAERGDRGANPQTPTAMNNKRQLLTSATSCRWVSNRPKSDVHTPSRLNAVGSAGSEIRARPFLGLYRKRLVGFLLGVRQAAFFYSACAAFLISHVVLCGMSIAV
jgi:hypothetical protein